MPSEPIIDTSSTYTVDYNAAEVVNAWQTKRLRMLRIDNTS